MTDFLQKVLYVRVVIVLKLNVLILKFSTKPMKNTNVHFKTEYFRDDSVLIMARTLLLLLLVAVVHGEQMCKMRGIFEHVVDYKCPEYGNSLLKYCCGPKSEEGKCCMEPNPNLEEEEEKMLQEVGQRMKELIALLKYLATGVGLLLGCCGFLFCCCRCCPCCYLARRRKEREEEREEAMMPLESVVEDATLAPGYSAPPWPPQHTVPQQWPYNPCVNQGGYPAAPPSYTQSPYNNSQTQPPAYPQLPYPTYS